MNSSLEKLNSLNYPVKLQFDPDDDQYIAEFLDLPGCSAAGSTPAEAYERAQSAKTEWFRVTLEQGLPIPEPSTPQSHSGRVLVRLPTSLHAALADRARLHGASLNQFIVHLLSAGAVKDESSDKLKGLADQVQKIQWQISRMNNYLSSLISHPAQAVYSGATTVNVSTQLTDYAALTGQCITAGLSVLEDAAVGTWGDVYTGVGIITNSPVVVRDLRPKFQTENRPERTK